MWKITGTTGNVAKIWHKPAEPELTAKLNAMLKINPRITVDGEIVAAWPTDSIYDSRGYMRGFLMPEAENTIPIENLYTRQRRNAKNITAERHQVARVAMRIAATMEILHRNNCYIGDVNPKNILVRRDNLFPFIIDCDSFQVPNPQDPNRPFPSTVMWMEYQPPERKDPSTVPIDEHNDLFCLAVLTYMLLFNGVHPFQGKDNPGIEPAETREARIAAHRFTHASPREWDMRPDQQNEWSRLPRELQENFNRAMDYKQYGRDRPKTTEWLQALRSIANDSQTGWLVPPTAAQQPNRTDGRTITAEGQGPNTARGSQPNPTVRQPKGQQQLTLPPKVAEWMGKARLTASTVRKTIEQGQGPNTARGSQPNPTVKQPKGQQQLTPLPRVEEWVEKARLTASTVRKTPKYLRRKLFDETPPGIRIPTIIASILTGLVIGTPGFGAPAVGMTVTTLLILWATLCPAVVAMLASRRAAPPGTGRQMLNVLPAALLIALLVAVPISIIRLLQIAVT